MSESENANSKEIILDRTIFSSFFNSLAILAGQPFVAEEGQYEMKKHLVNILKGGEKEKGAGRQIRFGILSTILVVKERNYRSKAAAEDMVKMIQEVRISKPEINKNKNYVRNIVREKYGHIISDEKQNAEVNRYNFFLYQLEQMRKAEFVRIDNDSFMLI